MVKYFYKNNKFIVEDYQNAKHFASFLPAIAGATGKPLWAFFASVGQCMGGFGIDDRNTSYTPFDFFKCTVKIFFILKGATQLARKW